MFFVSAVSTAIGKEIKCKYTELDSWPIVGDRVTCRIKMTVVIHSNDVTFLADPTVEALDFGNNMEIKFFPVDVARSFPNLSAYGTGDCAIKEVGKIHFQNLNKLRFLGLDNHEIETVPSDTFEGLIALMYISMGKISFH